jgi:hypothetical protein
MEVVPGRDFKALKMGLFNFSVDSEPLFAGYTNG